MSPETLVAYAVEHLPADIALLLDAELDAIESSQEWHRLDAEMQGEQHG